MTRVLITGVNSFVGTNFRKFSRFKDIEEASIYNNNVRDINFGKYDVVLHLAAIVHQSKKIAEKEYFNVNTDLCLLVAELSKKAGIRQFVFLSSLKVYGEHVQHSELRNENSECHPDDAYGKSKYAAEIGLLKMNDASFKVSIIRTPLIYGEGVKANMLSLIRLIDTFPLLPFGKIENKRNFTFVENLVGFIDKIIEKNAPGIFIATDDESISTTRLVNYISKYLGKRTFLFKLPHLFIRISHFIVPDIIGSLYVSAQVENYITKKVLDYKPPFSTEEGIKKTVSYYLEKKKQKKKL
jgi:nucleoside-diphosphate-sugar epimerase